MASLSAVKLELDKGVNNMGVTSGLKAVRRMTPEQIASNNKLKAESKGGYQGRKGQKALNLDKLPSLNVNTGTSSNRSIIDEIMPYTDNKFLKHLGSNWDSKKYPNPISGPALSFMSQIKRGSAPGMKKGGAVKTHTMPDGTKMKGAKHGMKAGGYVLSAKDKTRKESFESSPPAKRGISIKKSATKEMKHGGLVDRNYLKGK